jgi:hypothetical protein
MALEIVWRSPLTLIRPELMLERTSSDEFGAVYAVYAVTAPDLVKEFEVVPGEVA